MRRSVYERDVQAHLESFNFGRSPGKVFAPWLMSSSPAAPRATAVHAREITLVVFRYAIERGQKMLNPAQEATSSTIATVEPKDRALSQEEIGQFCKYLEQVEEYVFPSRYGRYGPHRPMSAATLNRVTTSSWEYAQNDQQPLGKLGPRDRRCAGSTILHEAGHNSD